MNRVYKYKSTININYWKIIFSNNGLRLSDKDIKLLNNTKCEKINNDCIKRIHKKALEDNLYIPELTDGDGDCMFESLMHTGLCDDYIEFRKIVALLFYLFGESKSIIPNHNDTLKNIFKMYNEIEYVFCNNNNRLYKYSYYTMCSDIYDSGGWSRLPTHLVLILLSTIFKVRFHIYHDNGHISKIVTEEVDNIISEDDREGNIYLGLIGEEHYIPLIKRDGNTDELICPKYKNYLKKFHKWARFYSDIIGLYDDIDSNNINENNK